jgi:hypothetical protein
VAYGNGRFVIVADDRHFTSADGVAWTPVSLQGSAYKVRFSNGRFFAFSRSLVQVSDNGLEWRQIYADPTIATIRSVAEYAGRYVVGDGFGRLRHWTPGGEIVDALPGGAYPYPTFAITAVAGQFFAASQSGQVLRSDDARRWSEIAQLATIPRAIVHGNGRFVIASEGGPFAVQTSTDGVTWSGAALGSTSDRLVSVAFGDGMFVAATTTGSLYYSRDGLGWTQTGSPFPVQVRGMAFGAGRFVAVSVQGHIGSSPDGVNWTLRKTEAGWLEAVTFGAQGFVVAGRGSAGGIVWASPDGAVWTQRQTDVLPHLTAAAYGNGVYMLAGYDGIILLSQDGITWQRRTAGVHPVLFGAAAANGRFVAVGSGGAIVMSAQ